MFLWAFVLAAIFGGADQYLGSLTTHGWGIWTVAVSQMSATWLLLPFLAGMTQDRARRAVRLGLWVTYAALLGYFVMTLSPTENVSLHGFDVARFLRSQADLLIGGVITGPVFGYLGHRWRVSRAWWAALLLAITACGEPVARTAAGRLYGPDLVWLIESSIGVTMLVGLALAGAANYRRAQDDAVN
jgi:hypothetical protein